MNRTLRLALLAAMLGLLACSAERTPAREDHLTREPFGVTSRYRPALSVMRKRVLPTGQAALRQAGSVSDKGNKPECSTFVPLFVPRKSVRCDETA